MSLAAQIHRKSRVDKKICSDAVPDNCVGRVCTKKAIYYTFNKTEDRKIDNAQGRTSSIFRLEKDS